MDTTPTDNQPEEKTVLSIILTKDGVVKVSGMINDKIASYGFLEMAKEVIKNHHDEMASKIVQPNHRIMDFIRNGKK